MVGVAFPFFMLCVLWTYRLIHRVVSRSSMGRAPWIMLTARSALDRTSTRRRGPIPWSSRLALALVSPSLSRRSSRSSSIRSIVFHRATSSSEVMVGTLNFDWYILTIFWFVEKRSRLDPSLVGGRGSFFEANWTSSSSSSSPTAVQVSSIASFECEASSIVGGAAVVVGSLILCFFVRWAGFEIRCVQLRLQICSSTDCWSCVG
mmetsp:Transcript_22585/g.50477  ORF Transcript_22585/g.50477 Transcript_22585/m.50477 type:complete len:205 (+) Transcript_22585:859-1473(+)